MENVLVRQAVVDDKEVRHLFRGETETRNLNTVTGFSRTVAVPHGGFSWWGEGRVAFSLRS